MWWILDKWKLTLLITGSIYVQWDHCGRIQVTIQCWCALNYERIMLILQRLDTTCMLSSSIIGVIRKRSYKANLGGLIKMFFCFHELTGDEKPSGVRPRKALLWYLSPLMQRLLTVIDGVNAVICTFVENAMVLCSGHQIARAFTPPLVDMADSRRVGGQQRLHPQTR